jgi:hypothetical protein
MKSFPLSSVIQPNEAIKPWIIAGPFYQDVSDRIKTKTFFEDPHSSAGKDVMLEIVEKAKRVCLSPAQEGQKFSFANTQDNWRLVRKYEEILSWGRYNFSNHCCSALLTTTFIPEHQGTKQFELLTDARTIIGLNGKIVFDSENCLPIESLKFGYGYLHKFQLSENLLPGLNSLIVALFRIGRTSSVNFSIKCNDKLEVSIPLPERMTTDSRKQIEEEISSIRFERNVFYPEHNIEFLFQKVSTPEIRMRTQLLHTDGSLIKENIFREGNKVVICSGTEIPDGEYQIKCIWENCEKQFITNIHFNIAKITPTPTHVGFSYFEERRKKTLEHFSENLNFLYDEIWNPVAGYIIGQREQIWAEVAKYALGLYKKLNEKTIIDTCKFIMERRDCSEFLLQAIIRLMYWERKSPKLNLEVREFMKKTILGFRYWVDEPGEALMHMGSENHRLLLHSAEYLAGQLFPSDEFPNSQQRGLFHILKGRMYLIEWLQQRGKFGFDEWNSNCYYAVNTAPLTNVYDFTPQEDCTLRQLVRQVLNYMFFILAEDTFHGIFGTPCGRTYGSYIKYPDFQYTASISWLLYGEGSLWGGTGMGAVSLATSTYKPLEILSKIAGDYSSPTESFQKQGFESPANFVVYRTPYYMLSSLQNYQKGICAPQTHVAQLTFQNKAIIFWSCPYTTEEGPGLRPDYWSGNMALPKTLQFRNVLALIFHENKFSLMNHCFIEPSKFDEIKLEGRWLFARIKKSFVGIFSENGMAFGQSGFYAERELVCCCPNNIWLVECGSKDEFGSFEKFIEKIRNAEIEENGEGIIYDSPSIGKFKVGWESETTVNGDPIEFQNHFLIKSKWANSEFGSGQILIQYKNEKLEFLFP